MARLNEPAAPMENIESLKRKFMRQNRDIARVNSTQSVRIRNLENEVSNILAENLLLREQLSRYKLELEGGKAQRVAEHTGEVKAQLEEKLQELSALISGLGHPPKTKRLSLNRGKITIVNPNQSPISKTWRNDVAEQEGRLPPIPENKTYPRKTLERQELLDIAANAELDAPDSPEIGPPPVSQFVSEDPVKIDLPKRIRPQASDEIGLDPSLSINLEQRRKRKDSGGSSESRRSSRSELVEESNAVENSKMVERSVRTEPIVEDANFATEFRTEGRPHRQEFSPEEPSAATSLRAGERSSRHEPAVEEPSSVIIKIGGRSNRQELAKEDPVSTTTIKLGGKRKLSVREDEDNQVVTRSVESPDDFTFTRPTQETRTKNHATSQADRPVNRSTRELAVARGGPRIKQTEPLLPAGRKVLAPKSINNSPRKTAKSTIHEDSKPSKPDAPKFNPTKDRRERRQEPVQIQLPDPPAPLTEAIIVQPELQPESEPETPAGLDLFSPQSSLPSTARVESRDTPPPTELGSGSEGQRPSRRARGSVSYAEPNLRDKMRRPTKDLTDAVGRDDKTQRGSSVNMGDGLVVRIKDEPEGDNAWREMPAASSATTEGSPLRSKAPSSDSLPSSITTHRKRRESLLQNTEPENHTSGSGSAIATLLAETRKAKAAVREGGKGRPQENDAISNGMSKMDIYEFKDPSPQVDYTRKDSKENRPTARVSRRHSAMPHEPTPEDSDASDMEVARKPGIPSSRRRQSSLALKSSSSRNDLSSKEMASERGLKRSSSAAGVGGDSGLIDSRSDRMTARRRSMML